MDAVLLALVVVFVAELGDKSQLLAVALSTRLPTRWVVIGLVIAVGATQALAALAGDLLGAVVGGPLLSLAAAGLFGVFAVLSLRGDSEGDEHSTAKTVGGGAVRVVAGVAAAVFLAEAGDKTMLATLTLATREGFWPIWIGATAGMSMAGLLGVAVGRVLGDRLSPPALRWAAAAMFATVGLWLAYDGLSGLGSS